MKHFISLFVAGIISVISFTSVSAQVHHASIDAGAQVMFTPKDMTPEHNPVLGASFGLSMHYFYVDFAAATTEHSAYYSAHVGYPFSTSTSNNIEVDFTPCVGIYSANIYSIPEEPAHKYPFDWGARLQVNFKESRYGLSLKLYSHSAGLGIVYRIQ